MSTNTVCTGYALALLSIALIVYTVRAFNTNAGFLLLSLLFVYNNGAFFTVYFFIYSSTAHTLSFAS